MLPLREPFSSIGLLLLRLGAAGTMLIQHGWPKLAHFSDKAAKFSDPLGVGSTTSLTLATFAEAFCAAAVVLGLLTRIAALPLAFTMGTAFFVVHAADPFGKKELPMLFGIVFASIALLGPGRFSVDARFFKRLV